jgi:hypothetical protein
MQPNASRIQRNVHLFKIEKNTLAATVHFMSPLFDFKSAQLETLMKNILQLYLAIAFELSRFASQSLI